MQLQYLNAPMYYIEGIPAYKTGEWMGQKGCKFGPTRKIVRPVNNENPILTGNHGTAHIMPRKKHFEYNPTPEYVFRPCCKMVNENFNRKERIESIKPVKQEIIIHKERPERKHQFGYLENRDFEIKSKLNSGTEENIKQEFKNMIKIGFSKQKYTNDFLRKIQKAEGYNNAIPKEDCSGKQITSLKEDRKYVKNIDKLPNINL